MSLRVFAIGAHPDDIEFMMSGTLLRLKDVGAELHYMHLSAGSCGTMELSRDEIARVRRSEAERAATLLGAEYHPSIADDIEIFYTDRLIRKLAAVVRQVAPDCLLIPSTVDYMEDHQNTGRIAATAAFCRGMPNYITEPDTPIVDAQVAVYHAMPYGLAGPLGETIFPEFLVDITGTETARAALLETHASQRDWLDASQGPGTYVEGMLRMSQGVADAYRTRIAGADPARVKHAEGWRRRLHLGYCAPDFRPLETAIEAFIRPVSLGAANPS